MMLPPARWSHVYSDYGAWEQELRVFSLARWSTFGGENQGLSDPGDPMHYASRNIS